jgi:hypothetical protein
LRRRHHLDAGTAVDGGAARPGAEISALTINDNFHTTIPHEMGHILMDHTHAQVATEMMGAGSPVGANERVVNGPKRISDPTSPRTVSYDDGFRGNPVNMLRTDNPGVIDPF